MGELKNKIRFTTTLPKDLADKLRKLSEATRIPQSRLVEEAVTDLLRKHAVS